MPVALSVIAVPTSVTRASRRTASRETRASRQPSNRARFGRKRYLLELESETLCGISQDRRIEMKRALLDRPLAI